MTQPTRTIDSYRAANESLECRRLRHDDGRTGVIVTDFWYAPIPQVNSNWEWVDVLWDGQTVHEYCNLHFIESIEGTEQCTT